MLGSCLTIMKKSKTTQWGPTTSQNWNTCMSHSFLLPPTEFRGGEDKEGQMLSRVMHSPRKPKPKNMIIVCSCLYFYLCSTVSPVWMYTHEHTARQEQDITQTVILTWAGYFHSLMIDTEFTTTAVLYCCEQLQSIVQKLLQLRKKWKINALEI